MGEKGGWERTFKALDHWETAQSVEAKDKSLIIQPGETDKTPNPHLISLIIKFNWRKTTH